MAMSRKKKMFLFAPFALLAFVLFIALGGELVRLLWNMLLPPLFGVAEITFWQALALLALCRILFGGLGMRGSGHHGSRRAMSSAFERAFHRMDASWDQMTPEERERFRQRMRDRFGAGPANAEGKEV